MPFRSARCWRSAGWSASWTALFPELQVLISTTTRTGQALARERFGANRVFYCPLDLPWAVRAYLNALQPQLLILAETEFWPNLLNGCFRRADSGRRGECAHLRSLLAALPDAAPVFGSRFLRKLSRVLAQSETDAKRLKAIGCRPDRVTVSGNLKFDVRAAQEAEATQLLKCSADGLRFVVAGSTLEGEEAALLEAWPKLLEGDPQLAMVLAPRHPERFGAVAALLAEIGESLDAAIGLERRPRRMPLRRRSIPAQIVLLDTIGELASVYSLAAVAFVGGSLVPAGGHNPLEPAQFGVPDRHGSALRQLPHHHRGSARARWHSHRPERGSGQCAGRSAAQSHCCCGDGRIGRGRSSKSRPGQRNGRCMRSRVLLAKGQPVA